MNLSNLCKPFPEASISWRVGATNKKWLKPGEQLKGIALAYLTARDVMERLDTVCGVENWQCRYPFAGCCEIGIKCNNLPLESWVWKSNGAGTTDIEAEKGQFSDSFKRAAVMWGVGRYLYDMPNTKYPINEYGKFVESPKLPQWATPNGWNRISPDVKKAVYEQSIECMSKGDESGLQEVWNEFETEEKAVLWGLFNASERTSMKEFMK